MARQKYFGEWCIAHAGSETYAREIMARDHGLLVVPKSEDIEVTEESDFDGPDFARFSTNSNGCDYNDIINSLHCEDGVWLYTTEDEERFLEDEDFQYLKEYYAEEMYKVLNGEPQNIGLKAQQRH